MAEICTIQEAIRNLVHDGDTVALEGFTHLIPFAAGHEIIRQGRRDLTLIRLTPDLLYDQMIGMGCCRKLIFSWGGNPGVGSLHRLRDAIEHDWPAPLEIEEYSHAAMAAAFDAGAANLPFAMLRGCQGVDLTRVNPQIKNITCPYTGQKLATVPAIRPDVGIVHAQRADRQGNVLFTGIVGVQKECILSSKRSLVTVEEIVDSLNTGTTNGVVVPGWAINSIAVCPKGAWPSYAFGYYSRNNAFYKQWDDISRDRAAFERWMQQHVINAPVAQEVHT